MAVVEAPVKDRNKDSPLTTTSQDITAVLPGRSTVPQEIDDKLFLLHQAGYLWRSNALRYIQLVRDELPKQGYDTSYYSRYADLLESYWNGINRNRKVH